MLDLIWALASATLAVQGSVQPVTVHYHERPPYYQTSSYRGPIGLVADPVVRGVTAMGSSVHYQLTPAKRQLQLLQANTGRDCAMGWYKNPERERRLRYSDPIYRDQPMVLVTRKNEQRLPQSLTLSALASSGMVWLKKSGYSYGTEVDHAFTASASPVEESTVSDQRLLQMLMRARADFLFAPPEEIEPLIAQHADFQKQLSVHQVAGLVYGEWRYLICSMQVEPEWIDRFNASLNQHGTASTAP